MGAREASQIPASSCLRVFVVESLLAVDNTCPTRSPSGAGPNPRAIIIPEQQHPDSPARPAHRAPTLRPRRRTARPPPNRPAARPPVSYTHLTLPTIYSV